MKRVKALDEFPNVEMLGREAVVVFQSFFAGPLIN